jgi:hypothetical protein
VLGVVSLQRLGIEAPIGDHANTQTGFEIPLRLAIALLRTWLKPYTNTAILTNCLDSMSQQHPGASRNASNRMRGRGAQCRLRTRR